MQNRDGDENEVKVDETPKTDETTTETVEEEKAPVDPEQIAE